MNHRLSSIRYLLVTHIPFSRTSNGDVIVDELWGNDLKALKQQIGSLRVVAPELGPEDAHHSWSPSTCTLDKGLGISFSGFRPMRSQRDLVGLLRMRRVLRKEVREADLVHTGNFFPPYLGLQYAHRLANRLGKKTVYIIVEDFVDMLQWEWVRPCSSYWKKLYRSWMVRKMEKKARKGASTASLTFLFTPSATKRFRLDPPRSVSAQDMTHEIEDVISERDFEKKCQDILDNKPLLICAASRHRPLKGLDFLIRAIGDLKRRGIYVQARILGEGPSTAMLQKLSRDLGINDRVCFVGGVPPGKKVYEEIAAAHVFAMPHRTNDFARSFYDAMACGTPVVAFHTVSSEGIVRNEVDGLVVPLDNVVAYGLALERINADRSLLVKMARGARARALSETRSSWHKFRAEMVAELFTDEPQKTI